MNVPEPLDPRAFAAGMRALHRRLAERVLPQIVDPAQRTKVAALVAKLDELQAQFPEIYERETARRRAQANRALEAAQAIMDQAKQRLQQIQAEAAQRPVRPPRHPAPTAEAIPAAAPPRLWEPVDWPLSDAAVDAAAGRLVRRVRAAPPPVPESPASAGDVAALSSGAFADTSSDSADMPIDPPPAPPKPPPPRPRDRRNVADMQSDEWQQ